AEYNEPPSPVESSTQRDLLRTEQTLVEASRRVECLAGAEEEAAVRQAQGAEEVYRQRFQEAAVEGDATVVAIGTPAAHGARTHCLDRRTDRRPGDHRIGVDEDQHLADGFSRPGVTRGGDLAVIHGHNPGAVLPRDVSGAVRGGVVHDHDLERLPRRPSRVVQRAQRAAQDQFLIVSRDYDGDHASLPHRRLPTKLKGPAKQGPLQQPLKRPYLFEVETSYFR